MFVLDSPKMSDPLPSGSGAADGGKGGGKGEKKKPTPTDEDVEKLKKSLRAHRGHFTRALNVIDRTVKS